MPAPPRYLPIADYAIIGNLHTTALVSLRGSIDYLCLPRFDSPSVFAAILDADKGGCFSFTCEEESTNYKQLYLPATNILLTRYLSQDGIAEVTDFMPIAGNKQDFAIFRRLKCVHGHHRIRIDVKPAFDYARSGGRVERMDNATGYRFHDPAGKCQAMLLLSPVELEITENGLTGYLDLDTGDDLDFILTLDTGTYYEADFLRYFNETRKYWVDWSAKCTYDGPWQESVLRSALALKLLTSAEFGSTIAAGTFSLPEVIGGKRNWDYRFSWIRDSAFTMYAFLRLGYKAEAEAYIGWIKQQCMDNLQLMYGVDGATNLEEIELNHLEGYKGSKPVRIGNGAYDQKQLDIYGELIDTIYLYNQSGGSITHAFWKEICTLVAYVIDHWKEKDHGIWEVRSGKERFLHSAVCCWVALDRAMKIGEDRSLPYPQVEWRKVRDEIYGDIYENFWNEEVQAYTQFKGSDTVDASALLMPLLRFVSSKEPRWLKTFAAIEDKLTADVLVFRYKTEHGATDGLEGKEASFTICSFWYAECLARIGRIDDATVVMQKLLGYGNHVGLFSEEIGLHGEQLGNFPQAFSHLSLISAAFQIEKKLSKGT
jgi:GH15 family glucan-1,4-alpha-glucosidase